MKKTDRVVVIDVEATCWQAGHEPKDAFHDIIEIGVAEVDAGSWVISRTESILVDPGLSKLSPYCLELTGLRAEELHEKGLRFAEACERLKAEYHTREYPWASWGDYDRWAFQTNADAYECPYPFRARHINVKTLYALKRGLKKEVGVKQAVKRLGWEFEGRQHRGIDDAINIAKLLCFVFTDGGEG